VRSQAGAWEREKREKSYLYDMQIVRNQADYSGEPVSRKAASLRLAKLQELFGYIKKEISDDKF
jgi:hypothetical protein